MDYEVIPLKSGIKLLAVPMRGLESVSATIWVGVGSRCEPENIAGISHFLEHMTFKGGKKYKTAQEVAEAFDQLGAEHNAGTSREWTNFYMKVRKEKLAEGFEILTDGFREPLFKEDDIEKERGSILEEISMYEDMPMDKVGDYFNEIAFKGNFLGRDIAGSRETVRKMKKGDFVDFRSENYVTSNIFVSLAGNFDKNEAVELCQKYLSEFPGGSPDNFQKFVSFQEKPQVYLKSKKSEQAHVIFGFQCFPRSHKLYYPQMILSTILGRGASSRLFDEIRWKRGLAYAIYTSSTSYKEVGSFDTYAGVDINKVDEVIKLVAEIHKSLADKKSKITTQEMSKAKEFLKGHIALSLEDTENASSFFGERFVKGDEILTPDQVYKKLDEVTEEEVYMTAKELFIGKRLNVAIVGPYEDRVRFEKLLVDWN